VSALIAAPRLDGRDQRDEGEQERSDGAEVEVGERDLDLEAEPAEADEAHDRGGAQRALEAVEGVGDQVGQRQGQPAVEQRLRLARPGGAQRGQRRARDIVQQVGGDAAEDAGVRDADREHGGERRQADCDDEEPRPHQLVHRAHRGQHALPGDPRQAAAARGARQRPGGDHAERDAEGERDRHAGDGVYHRPPRRVGGARQRRPGDIGPHEAAREVAEHRDPARAQQSVAPLDLRERPGERGEQQQRQQATPAAPARLARDDRGQLDRAPCRRRRHEVRAPEATSAASIVYRSASSSRVTSALGRSKTRRPSRSATMRLK